MFGVSSGFSRIPDALLEALLVEGALVQEVLPDRLVLLVQPLGYGAAFKNNYFAEM